MALPVILNPTTDPSAGQPGVVDTAGTSFEGWLYQCDFPGGTTYTRTLVSVWRGPILEARWRMDRVGGPDSCELLLEGAFSGMDTATDQSYEVDLRRGTGVWYRGRVVTYRHETRKDGGTQTRVFLEGYQTYLHQIRFTASYTATTVANIVKNILDSYVTNSSRISYISPNIVGAYSVNSISFTNATVAEALRILAILQGSTEWGVYEGVPPEVFFLAESTATSETNQVMLGANTPALQEGGSFARAYNKITVLGGYSAGAQVSGSYTDTAASSQYGVREKVISEPTLLNANDCIRFATNIAAAYSSGQAYVQGAVSNPASRLEPDRSSNGAKTGSPKATFRGVDGAVYTALWNKIDYVYQHGSGFRLDATVSAGFPEDDVVEYLRDMDRRIRALVTLTSETSGLLAGGQVAVRKNSGATIGTRHQVNLIEGTGISLNVIDDPTDGEIEVTITASGGAAHAMLSATHSDSTAAAIVRGDIITGQGASPTWSRLAVGTGTQYLKGGTEPAWGAIAAGDLPTGIDAAKINTGVVSNAEFNYLDGVTSAIQGQIDGKQPLDADLTAIAALAVARGSIIVGSSAPAWSLLAIGTAGKILRSDGTDLLYSTATFPTDATRGAVLVASAASTWAALAVGANGKVLHSDGTDATWQALVNADIPANLTVRKDSGADIGTRKRLNLIQGTNITLTVTDDPTDSEIDITITAPGFGTAAGTVCQGNDARLSDARTPTAHAASHTTGADILQVSATDKVLGRSTAGAGNVEEIACTASGRAMIAAASATAQTALLDGDSAAGTKSLRTLGTGATQAAAGDHTHAGGTEAAANAALRAAAFG